MTNLLPFSEALLASQLAGYAFCSCPAQGEKPRLSTGEGPNLHRPFENWLTHIAARSLAAALLLAATCQFAPAGNWLAAVILITSLVLPVLRKLLIPVARLAEFEIFANALTAFVLWSICQSLPERATPVWLPSFNVSRLSALCASAAIFLYAIRGGSLIVRGILEKAGGLPNPAQTQQCAPDASSSYRHGEAIGQIERIVVILIVIAGTFQALAFFFAAKGLIRSKELEDRTVADYFLLGSLGSFLVALVAGLIVQNVLATLWK